MSRTFRGILIHDSFEARRNETREKFQKNSVQPGFAARCSDGIVLFAPNDNPNAWKIHRLLDRVAFLGVGAVSDYQTIYDSLSAKAKTLAYTAYSKGDMRLVEELVKLYSRDVRSVFRQLHGTDYFECEFIVAQLGHSMSEDRLWSVELDGSTVYVDESNYIVVPMPDESTDRTTAEITRETLTSVVITEETTMADAIRKFAGILPGNLEKYSYEVALLSRAEALNKHYGRVYKKLTHDELRVILES